MSSSESGLQKSADEILEFLAEQKEKISPILIVTHDYPDPDSLASAFALQFVMEHYGISSRIAYGGIIGRMENRAMVQMLRLPVHKLRRSDFKKYEHTALIDTQPAFGNNSFPKNRRATLVIDQHPSETKPNADLAVIDTECGATSTLLSQCLLTLGLEIPVQVATSLAYGILSDTLNLFRCKQPGVVEAYLQILWHSDLKILGQIQNPVRSRKFFSSLGMAIQQATVRRGLIVSHLGHVESPDLVSQVADFLLTYKGSKWSFCTGRYKGKIHVSLRTVRQNVEAGEILRDIFENRGQAGGHDTIAGGSFKVGGNEAETVWQEIEQTLLSRLMKRLRIPLKGEFYCPFKRAAAPKVENSEKK